MAAPDITESEPTPGPPREDLTPEGRRRAAVSGHGSFHAMKSRVGPGTQFYEIAKRVVGGTWNDGMMHAGNLAYMAMLAIFPFFITGAAIFALVGGGEDRTASITAILSTLPPSVSETIGPVAREVVDSRSGWLLWVGGLFGLWTVGSLIETIRDLLRRAYGTEATVAFWKTRLFSTAIIIGAVLLLILSLIAQVLIGAAQEVIGAFIPELNDVLGRLAWSRIIPAFGLFGSIYMLFYILTPAAYRVKRYPKWPGALLVTVWWVAVTVIMPIVLRNLISYDLTYGSLAGIMIALFFFWLVGLGMVAGAELNAALAETPEEELDRVADQGEARTESIPEDTTQ